jgi:hypothetical protein
MPVVFLRRRPSLPQVRAGFVVPKPFQITEPVHHHKIQQNTTHRQSNNKKDKDSAPNRGEQEKEEKFQQETVVVPFPPHFQSAARPSPLRHQAARVVHVLWYRAIDPQHGASVVATVATVATVAAAVAAVVVLSKKCFQQPSGLLFGPVPRFRR